MPRSRDERREAEMQRGAAVVAQIALSARFNPEHVPETHPHPCSPAEQQRRREYAERMKAQVAEVTATVKGDER